MRQTLIVERHPHPQQRNPPSHGCYWQRPQSHACVVIPFATHLLKSFIKIRARPQSVLYTKQLILPHNTIDTVSNPDFKTSVDNVQTKRYFFKSESFSIFLCVHILYTIFVGSSCSCFFSMQSFVKFVTWSTFSGHLPSLALGTVNVSGCVALAGEHTRTAGCAHTAKVLCQVIQHRPCNTVEWVLIALWDKMRREAEPEGVTSSIETAITCRADTRAGQIVVEQLGVWMRAAGSKWQALLLVNQVCWTSWCLCVHRDKHWLLKCLKRLHRRPKRKRTYHMTWWISTGTRSCCCFHTDGPLLWRKRS